MGVTLSAAREYGLDEGFGDVDTTCAITGGIVAARTGVDAVPERWLRRREALPGGAGHR